ncbi:MULTISPECIES: isochorismate synthase MenF [unclassified Haladaptatus]|uniref:isochorismate synthase n=1 Tax=unclassified Haladaptatus TaxID=2622732 RepID=UPI0023E7EBB8|nr:MULTISPECIES: isochorismate synthase [unclassified Haladaptatus]
MEPLRSDETVAHASGDATLESRVCEIERLSLHRLLDAADAPRIAWSTPDGPTIVAFGAADVLTAEGTARFDDIRSQAETLFARSSNATSLPEAARPRLFGGFSFNEGPTTDEHSAWAGFPDAQFILPRVQVSQTAEKTYLTVTLAGPGATPEAANALLEQERESLANLPTEPPTAAKPGVASLELTTPRETWTEQVEAALARIERGELTKVVLAQALTATLEDDLSVPGALTRLAEAYPDCHRFLVAPDEHGTFFGATPEGLVSLRGRTVSTVALAGSTGRGETPEEDEWLGAELLASEKDRHEHDVVAETIREQLCPFASSVSLGERGLRRLATVQHLQTPITAELKRDEHVLSLVEALHPTPAVGGLPPERAKRTIRETETFDRGWYAAPVGWFDAAGNGSFVVAIRSAIARGDEATLFAGAGIVADSDPDGEWDEIQLKYRPMLDELE